MTLANFFFTSATADPSAAAMELVCPVNSLVTLRAAVDNGADWIHLDYCEHDEMPGMTHLNFDIAAIYRGIRYAHDKHCKALLAINAHAQLPSWGKWRDAIDLAAQCGVDAVALSDPALLLYAAAQHSHLRLHYRLQDETLNCESIDFFHKHFGVARVLLPRVLTLAQVTRIAASSSVELQVIGFGRHSSIIEGINATSGNRQARSCDEPHTATYDTGGDLCAIAENAANDGSFALDRQPDIGTLKLLPQLATLGISAIQIEALGHGPAQLAQVTRVWREAVDECLENLDHFSVKPSWIADLNRAAKDRKAS